MTTPADVLAGLLALVREAAREGAAQALAAHAAHATSNPEPLLTIDGLAHAESCSRATIRRLMREGAPHTFLGASPRFDLTTWRGWCAERGRRGTQAAPSKRETVPGVRWLGRDVK